MCKSQFGLLDPNNKEIKKLYQSENHSKSLFFLESPKIIEKIQGWIQDKDIASLDIDIE